MSTNQDQADESPQPEDIEVSDALDEIGAVALDAPMLADRLGPVGVFDRILFKFEVLVVVTALVIMSVLVFTDVVYQTTVSITQSINAGTSDGYLLIALLLGFVGAMAFAATGTSDDERPLVYRALITAVVVAVSAGFAWSLTYLESASVYRILLVALTAPVALHFNKRQERQRMSALLVATLIAFVLFGELPTGYSWAQSYSLILLLWVGFLGASMAARQRRHLRVDLARKLMSADKLPLFNAISYTVAAGFSAVVCYLGYIYIFGPDSTYIRPIWDAPGWLPEAMQQTLTTDFPLPDDASVWRRAIQVFFSSGEPGEIPDWLKVLAIPVSFFLITVRFIGHAFVFARMAVRKESFSESLGAH